MLPARPEGTVYAVSLANGFRFITFNTEPDENELQIGQ